MVAIIGSLFLVMQIGSIMMDGLNAAEAAFEIINRHQGQPIPEKVQRQYIEHGIRLGQALVDAQKSIAKSQEKVATATERAADSLARIADSVEGSSGLLTYFLGIALANFKTGFAAFENMIKTGEKSGIDMHEVHRFLYELRPQSVAE